MTPPEAGTITMYSTTWCGYCRRLKTQLDREGIGYTEVDIEQVVRRGPGERVDRLAGVAHDADRVAVAAPQVEQALLQGRHVLVLVDDEVPVLGPDGAGDGRGLLQDPHGQQQHVLEVDDVAVRLDVLVDLQQARDRRDVEPARLAPALLDRGGRVGLRRQQGDLGPLDLGGEVADGGPVDGQPQPRRGVRDEPGLVLHEGGHRAADHLRPEERQLPQGRGVEGAGLHPGDAERPQPPAQLARGPGGEGDGQHLLRHVDATVDAVRDPVGDRPRLARAGAGQHADRAGQAGRDLALLRVQPVEDGVGVGHRPIQAGVADTTGRRARDGGRLREAWTAAGGS